MKLALPLAIVLMFFMPSQVNAQQPTSSPLYEKCAMADPPEPTPLTCERPVCRTRACKLRVARRECARGKRRACQVYKRLLKDRCKCGRCVVRIWQVP